MIYERWIQENEDHSWKKLALCFGDVQLNPLARDIEQHFGFPSPSDRVTQVMDVPERDTSQDQQFSKEKDVPAMSLANPQDALIHQNRDTEHQAMVSRPEQLEVNETVTPMDTAASHHELRQE
ncbi:hypothetical protein GBAR_LOCUS6741 [Geodia barretti]|uniref:Uncharacterized protein n=1 Tax=Geodia barretti TaxID=519541 RepID=A0AA35WAM4_GEOBA|nr:hypothetical protein GBAR_LOCUS6741 [Geodia barretti]